MRKILLFICITAILMSCMSANTLAKSQPLTQPAPTPPAGMINLSVNHAYTITQGVSTTYSSYPYEATYFLNGALTNNLLGTLAAWDSGQWQGYLRGASRSVVIDMGQVNTVNQIQAHFLQYKAKGIYTPRKVSYSVSQDGINWSDAGTVNTSISLTSDLKIDQFYTVDSLNYQARYVRMSFPTDIWVFVDEFQVFGNTGIVNGATIPAVTPPPAYPDEYCAQGSATVGGARDMVLIYNGYYPINPALAENTVDELTPYVGYKTTSGAITDFMFDSFLFLPYTTSGAPSGGMYYCDTTKPTIMSDWIYYLDNTFDPVYNLTALNTTVGNVRTLLGDPAYKAKVEITIPYPTPTATDFGDVDGDGISENLTFLADREKVIKWYVDQVISRWTAADFANLELVGLYWYEEQADFQVNDDEAEMLSYAGNYIRGQGKVFNWIPFYQSMGFAEYDSLLGFDEAIMQPNYCFTTYPEEVLGEAADIIKHLGMGIEIEIHWNALTDPAYIDKYYSYLNYGVTKGYMTGAVHAYYQNGGPGTFYDSCVSTDPLIRDIYDQTYNFIKGTYVVH